MDVSYGDKRLNISEMIYFVHYGKNSILTPEPGKDNFSLRFPFRMTEIYER